MLAATILGALACMAVMATVIRIRSGGWHQGSLPVFAVIGGLFGFAASFPRRVRVLPQQVELCLDDFSVQGTRLCYAQLRGYSLIQPMDGDTTHRILMLYPQAGHAFSLGVPDFITDDQIQSHLRGRVPFVTILDDEALKPPTILPD